MRTRPIPALLLAALCVAQTAWAEAELTLGVESAIEYDDNVLVQAENPQSDYLVRAGPRFELRDEQGKLRYELRYYPSYERFFRLSELDGWTHDARGKLTWRASERTSFSVREQYLDSNRAVEAIALGEPIDPTGEAATVLGRRGFTQNIAGGELNHMLTRVDQLALTAQNVLSKDQPFQELTVTNGDVTSIGLSWLHALSGRNQAGLLVRYTNQKFENVNIDTQTQSDFYNASLQWIHHFDPTWSFSISGGPAWVTSDVPDPPEVFPDQPLYPLIRGATAPKGRC